MPTEEQTQDTQPEDNVTKKPTDNQQKDILKFALDIYQEYKDLNKTRNERLLKIYESFSTYEEERRAEWITTFKVNKAHEIVERVLPRLIAKNPRWIVTPKTDDFYPEKEMPVLNPADPKQAEQMKAIIDEKKSKTQDYSRAVQSYLEYIFDEYNFVKSLRLFAKDMVVYGKARCKVCYKYETVRNLITKDNSGTEIVEDVVGEYPYLDIKSWTEIYTDPRYRTVREMPAIVEVVNGVRLADLKKKEELFNLDKLGEVTALKDFNDDPETYRRRVQAIANIQNIDIKTAVNKNALTLIIVYALYDLEGNGDEKLYEITIADKLFVIGFKEITKFPLIEADCFEDTETNHSVGFVEPILGLQDELNFQKNAAINFINQALNRTFLWSPNSGIDPRDLVSKPYGVIAVTGEVSDAQRNLIELPMRTLPPDYFQAQNDIERQIQGQTFTVDTSNQRSQQALTDTATGMRIEFFESNSVLDQVRKNFEQALSEIAYLLLQEAFENIEDNIALKKMGADEYWDLNKEVLRDAVRRYTIKVEVGSSTFDDLENRRRDTMAFFNMLNQAKAAGVNVDMEEAVKDIIDTFEKRDKGKFLLPMPVGQVMDSMPLPGGKANMPVNKVEAPSQSNNPASLTQQVAKGDLRSLIPN